MSSSFFYFSKNFFLGVFLLGFSFLLCSCVKRVENGQCKTGLCPFALFEKKDQNKSVVQKTQTQQEPSLSLGELKKHLS